MVKLFLKTIVVAALILGGGLIGQAMLAHNRPEVGKYPKVYVGEEGLHVTIVRVGPREKNEVLVEISGIDHPWDGQIMLHKVQDVSSNAGPKFEYETEIDGRPYLTIVMRGDYGEVYIKGLKAKTIYYSEELSTEINPEHFLTAYLEQQTSTKK